MLALVNGDYRQGETALLPYPGRKRFLQRILMKLTARRGQFPFMENFGSRLWTLGQLRPPQRQAAAEQYVTEALADEAGLTVDSVTLTEEGGTGKADRHCQYGGDDDDCRGDAAIGGDA